MSDSLDMDHERVREVFDDICDNSHLAIVNEINRLKDSVSPEMLSILYAAIMIRLITGYYSTALSLDDVKSEDLQDRLHLAVKREVMAMRQIKIEEN